MKIFYTLIFFLASFAFIGCNSFVELDAPKTQVVSSNVFSNDAGARAAVSGILSQMMSGSSFASGGTFAITNVAGLSADELNNHSSSAPQVAVYTNSLTATNNTAVNSNWNDMYSTIYQSNAVIEGAQSSTGLSKSMRTQVTGEAKFLRAFAYFYLINLYGDVPLLTSTDYRVNRLASRAPTSEVYKQIELDLTEAQQQLSADFTYSGGEKVEPNKWAATALLARAFLYQKKWSEAESQSNALISGGQFSLAADLNSVFLANSDEAIWQLMPVFPGYNTTEATIMVISSNPTRVSATPAVTDVFEPGDNRATSWIATYTSGGKSYKYAYKYKVALRNQPVTEYYTVFRLAEQFLIRAEARAMQNNFTGAIADVNAIRVRAGLAPLDPTGLTQAEVLAAIAHERRAELFIEWGHRWFDLKRTGTIDAVLGSVKPGWQSTDALFPIPQTEINADPNLTQNPN